MRMSVAFTTRRRATHARARPGGSRPRETTARCTATAATAPAAPRSRSIACVTESRCRRSSSWRASVARFSSRRVERAHGATIVQAVLQAFRDGESRSSRCASCSSFSCLAFAGLLAVDLEPSSTSRAAVAHPARVTIAEAGARDGRGRLRPERLGRPRRSASSRRAPRPRSSRCASSRRGRRGSSAARESAPRFPTARGCARCAPTPRRGSRASPARRSAPGSAETKRMRLWQIAATLAPHGEKEHRGGRDRGPLRDDAPPRRPARRLACRDAARTTTCTRARRRAAARGARVPRPPATSARRTTTSPSRRCSRSRAGRISTARARSPARRSSRSSAPRDRGRPRAGPGRRIEIHRDLGVLLMVEDGEVVRAVHTSTGSGGITPVGDFKVYAKVLYSWSVPFQVWMPYAAYFRGGIATHQSPTSRPTPRRTAAFGCRRARPIASTASSRSVRRSPFADGPATVPGLHRAPHASVVALSPSSWPSPPRVRAARTGRASSRFYPQAGILWRDLYPNNFVDLDPSAGVCATSRAGPRPTTATPAPTRTSGASARWTSACRSSPRSTVASSPCRTASSTATTAHAAAASTTTSCSSTARGASPSTAISARGSRSSRNDRVVAGQQIGWTASSGNSTWPHLHFTSQVAGQVDEPFAGPCNDGPSG